ncbi:ATP-binding protein [Cupriavidus malaysiensis]|uniref:ATPase n=1 Tax=Cupriavidus malaysiensis TaxID=367825 RepID=A0A1D9I0E5_9BURK|nr:ATP-binding protein [Cupriavidus malaysiensis]AOZ05415.1 ATPase [Cupriavidus malaysiensis]
MRLGNTLTMPERQTPASPLPHDTSAGFASRHAWEIAPRSVADTGLEMPLLTGLLLKAAHRQRTAMLAQLVDVLKLPVTVVQEVAAFAVRERQLEVAHRGDSDIDVRYHLTDAGYQRASELTARCSYVGAAPVTLQAYCAAVRQHTIARVTVTEAELHAALGSLVIPPGTLDGIGIALNSSRPLMLFGPAGSGKTFLAQRLCKLLPGHIPVPHAITIAGEIIQVFDPLVHAPVGDDELETSRSRDRRWVDCHRPAVLSGGELTLEMLELRYEPASGFYQAPPHWKANNGIYIVDDLGRQRVAVTDLLNRWIVPLDRGVDTYALRSGLRFSVPFDVWPVFSSNLDPHKLADDAFLRRLGSKIYVGALDPQAYRRVFRQAADEAGLDSSDAELTFLIEALHGATGVPLLACIPGDLLQLIGSANRYHGLAPRVEKEALRNAWRLYFGAHVEAGGDLQARPEMDWGMPARVRADAATTDEPDAASR